MTDNTVPRVARFADLREGMTIERVCAYPSGTTATYVGVASEVTEHVAATCEGIWLATPSDDGNPHVTLRILAESPATALPTVAGAVIDCTLDGKPGAVLVLDVDGDWSGVSCDGECATVYERQISRITDWTVVYDPNAPKAAAADGTLADPLCGAMHPDSYICTLDADHTGPHVAMGVSVAHATWGDKPATADPLDENDHRDRIDKRGARIERRGDKHWHAEMASACSDPCRGNSLADWDLVFGPLSFADEVTA